jgi:hypothetical protein
VALWAGTSQATYDRLCRPFACVSVAARPYDNTHQLIDKRIISRDEYSQITDNITVQKWISALSNFSETLLL